MNQHSIEEKITEFWTSITKRLLFFLDSNLQSTIVSIIHYAIFIIGFFYFIFLSKPGDIFRIVFLIFVALAALSYFIFDKCFFTSVELKLSSQKNLVQTFIDKYFGEATEGNVTSKLVLSALTIICSIIIFKDYGEISTGK